MSIKFTPLSVDCSRYVIGIPVGSLSKAAWYSILRYFNPPYSMVSEMDDLIWGGTTLLLGQDGGWQNGNRRLYIENWNCVYQFLQLNGFLLSGNQPDLQFKSVKVMNGWKWPMLGGSSSRRSDYFVFPMLTMDQSLEIFTDQACRELVDRRFQYGFTSLWSVLQQRTALDRNIQLWQTVDVSIDGNDLCRRSLDLNLIDFNLESELVGLFLPAFHSFFPDGINSFKEFMSALGDGRISHISAGRTNEDLPFISFYFLIE